MNIGLKAVICGLVLGAIATGIHVVLRQQYDAGYQAAKQEARVRELQVGEESARKYAALLISKKQQEVGFLSQLQTLQDQHDKEKQDAANTEAQLRADIASGARKLYITTTRKPAAVPGDGAAGAIDPAFTCATCGEDRAELDPAAGIALVELASDGNQAIRDRNELIDRYNAVRAACNAGQSEQHGQVGAAAQ